VSSHGTDVNDGTAAALAQGGDFMLQAPEDAFRVHAERTADVGVGLLFDHQGLVAFGAGVVHSDVKAPELRQGGLDGPHRIGLLGLVSQHEACLRAQCLQGYQQGCASVGVQVRGDNPVASSGKGKGGGSANPRGGTGDEDDRCWLHPDIIA
jgi:hypothetical protein